MLLQPDTISYLLLLRRNRRRKTFFSLNRKHLTQTYHPADGFGYIVCMCMCVCVNFDDIYCIYVTIYVFPYDFFSHLIQYSTNYFDYYEKVDDTVFLLPSIHRSFAAFFFCIEYFSYSLIILALTFFPVDSTSFPLLTKEEENVENAFISSICVYSNALL